MRTETPQPIRLSDYRPPAFLVDEVHLDFQLEPNATRVRSRLTLRRNGEHAEPLRLDGVRLKPVSVAIDGRPLAEDAYAITPEDLTIASVPDAFVLETEVEIDPEGNKALEGLYMSGGRFCSQCEAEGFRKITWFPDRPDVLARYTVRIEADQAAFPRLLSNGNLTQSGALAGGRHFAIWTDPFPKPCYLFALVAGELDELADSFVTMSGRQVELRIYVDPGMAQRALYAMDSLKRSMKWDEETFGREYDLDLFMIVAVRDFNFGAMENKGLNVFNSSLLLADPETATDFDYERIEGVVAHEYFHNWTGNRITCRDWFQLCLKEGLTVFRDQSFSGDMRGAVVQRIKDVKALRARQFPEDAGPLAHQVRPSSYLKIDNFYTATIYEKGAEVIRMLKTILGAEMFRKGMDLYFERWDGHATTVEAFIQCFADVSGKDLSAFFAWYEQAGTPKLEVDAAYDAEAKALELTLSQATAPTPGQPDKQPLPLPVALGLLDLDGEVLSFRQEGTLAPATEAVVVLDQARQTLRFEGVASEPAVSVLRGFSAPVRVVSAAPAKHRYVQLAADPDLFNRWEAGQDLARDLILARAAGEPDEVGEERFAEAMGRALNDQAAEPAFKALLLSLPSESDLAVISAPADPAAIREARESLRARLAIHLGDQLRRLHGGLQEAGEFSASAEAAGRRALRNAALELLAADPRAINVDRAVGHFQAAGNMTDAMGGLAALMLMGGEPFEQALTAFYERWKAEPLVIDKWFAVQARSPSEDALGRVLGLTTHPDFDAKNPNRFRALVGTFAAGNPARFHDPSGDGYRFLADQILAVDGFNPMTAARLVEPLGGWRRYRPELGALMRAQLERIVATEGLSKNVFELASRALEG
ncbi:aminopeptidase N [Phenylobacterium montanum]|uniref:Aminopeptidase N n=1 Tax=Phenylobacterium montanum TaxID=2823693 RepID=A0A975ISV3_9CAUL|nr:aminopeptidase N [Caulobacter sp. S6]QUD86118.1 aminopeptidase N [Caulobacter sp. S6]